MFWLSAAILGLMGSLHCVGMCGPLVAALSISDPSKNKMWTNASLYHGARISAYGILGILPGLIGEGIQVTGFQQKASLVVGFLFLLAFVYIITVRNIHIGAWDRWSRSIHNLMKPWMQSQGSSRMLAMGFLNGFIPCGMTYMAMASALTADSLLGSMSFMMIFGLATTPALMAVSFMGIFKGNLQAIVPIGYLIVGLLLLYRGLYVEVPLNLKALATMGWEAMCH